MAFTPQQHREHREGLKAKGVCIICRRAPAVAGLVNCQACADFKEAHRSKRRREMDVCNDCGRELSEMDAGAALCASCCEASAMREMMRRSWS